MINRKFFTATALAAACISGQANAASSISFDIDKKHPYTAAVNGSGLIFEVQSYTSTFTGAAAKADFSVKFFGFFNGRICGSLPPNTPECVNPSYMDYNFSKAIPGPNDRISGVEYIPTFGSSTIYEITISTNSDGPIRFRDFTFGDLSPVEISGPAQFLPEPSTWAFMLAGFGLIGAVTRGYRKTRGQVVYA
jgi:hypothetical protein